MFYVSGGRTMDVVVVKQGPDSVKLTFAPGQDAYPAEPRREDPARRPSSFIGYLPDSGHPPFLVLDPPVEEGHTWSYVQGGAEHYVWHDAGTLTVPKGKGPFPAIVTITGSGIQDRDEENWLVKGFRPFRQIADSLGRAGLRCFAWMTGDSAVRAATP
jgi:hypothetical protein